MRSPWRPDFALHAEDAEPPYKEHVTKQAARGFTLVFKLYCEKCKFTDFAKISNMGWQGGELSAVLKRFSSGRSTDSAA